MRAGETRDDHDARDDRAPALALPARSPSLTMADYESLAAHFPLTVPTPTYVSHPTLLLAEHLATEHDLLRNPTSLPRWQAYLAQVTEEVAQTLLEQRGQATPLERLTLGERLATAQGRHALQRITDVYERALQHHPTSHTLWNDYLRQRSRFVLGTPALPLKLGAPRKRRGDDGVGRTMTEWLRAGKGEVDEIEDGERDYESAWEGALDGIVGWPEWNALAALHERALMWLPQMPRIWLSYLTMFVHPSCPAPLSHTHARRTFDRALRTLPPSLHERVWHLYLIYASPSSPAAISASSIVSIWRRYLLQDPNPTLYYIREILLSLETPHPLEAAKRLLVLATETQAGETKNSEGKSAYQLLGDFLEVVEQFPEEVGVDEEESNKLKLAREKVEAAREPEQSDANSKKQRQNGSRAPPPLDASIVDPTSSALLDVDSLLRTQGLDIYPDQAGRLWTGLATYWIKRGEFALARETFEEGLSTVVTLRDFTQVFDAYAEFEESYISGLMESAAEGDADQDDEQELDERMKAFEELMDRRPFLVNEVLLRRNPNDVQEWEKRVALYGNNDEKVAETYTLATKSLNSRKAIGPLNLLWVHFAKFYESGGVSGEAEADVASARKVFEKATKVWFRRVEELAEVWCEWAEMEVRNENYEEAIKVMQRAAAIPRDWKSVDYRDEAIPPQQRLFKSLKLWSFYVDLEESIGTVESTKAVYDQIFQLKIANAQVFINAANFLEENEYWEESFKIYEQGVALLPYPIAFEIWNAYLSKFIKRYGGDKLERARDLFEQALDSCPPKFCKPIYLLYGKLEEDHGLAKRAMAVYDRATRAVEAKDRMEMFTYYIAKATANFGLPATRPIYERAIEQLPDAQTAEMCLRFAALERKLGEIDRARAIFAHASQFCDPRTHTDFWAQWNSFEIETGSEDTFREYLRIKRAVQAAFNTEASYLSAKLQQIQRGQAEAQEAVNGGIDVDPMAALDRATGTTVRGFVPAASGQKVGGDGTKDGEEEQQKGNADEIAIDDDDDDDDEDADAE
ncbi:mRNA splicing protein SYF1 [Sporobolomyces koalae]|uniref:mRNA splicing protein SYF1 n=1 Tax=Sporobolomyces koalae TaxID=500713 RepID=UPI00316DFE65